jgi:hypothetical protein
MEPSSLASLAPVFSLQKESSVAACFTLDRSTRPPESQPRQADFIKMAQV